MGEARQPDPVKLICGMLAMREEWLRSALDRLQASFGPADDIGEVLPFDFTDYYEPEMGGPLLRQLAAFEDLIRPEALADVKLRTNELETQLAREVADGPERPVNLDPGYVSAAKLVLATTKDFGHRVYLRDGIYAESTLKWRKGGFACWDWTYPDYRTDAYRDFFARARERYLEQLAREHAPVAGCPRDED